jgi:hypothetical protein
MNISIDILFQIGTLICTVISVVWYISNTLGVINNKIDKSNQLNEIQEKKLESLEKSVLNNTSVCRDGRVKIWEDLNNLKLQVAKLEGQHKKE